MNEYRYLTELSERYPVLKQTENDIKASYAVSYTHLTLPTILLV